MKIYADEFPYTPERVEEIITEAEEWADAFWHGRVNGHSDHGPILSVIELAKSYKQIASQQDAAYIEQDLSTIKRERIRLE